MLEKLLDIEVEPRASSRNYSWVWRHAIRREWSGPEVSKEAAIKAAAADLLHFAQLGRASDLNHADATGNRIARF